MGNDISIVALSLVNCLWCVGLHALTRWVARVGEPLPLRDQPSPFWWVGFWLEKHARGFGKAFCNCLVCMSSIWGVSFFWLVEQEVNIVSMIMMVIYVVVLAGMNRIAHEIIS